MIEWIVVECARVRDVFVDGIRSGQTNQLIAVSRGTHRFDLGQPVNYKPRFRNVVVAATTRLVPRVIPFEV